MTQALGCDILFFMGYEENQKAPTVQKSDGRFRKVTGMWFKKRADNKFMAKSGLINREGWQNLQAFGENTILLVVPNVCKRGKKERNAPDYFLVSVEHHPADLYGPRDENNLAPENSVNTPESSEA